MPTSAGSARLEELEAAVDQADFDDPVAEPAPEPETPSGPVPAEPPAAAAPEPAEPASPAEPQVQTPEDEGPLLGESAMRFIDKHNGDINKAADDYWRIQTRSSEQARRIRELEQRLAQPPAAAPAPVAQPSGEPSIPSTDDAEDGLKVIEGRKALLIHQNALTVQHINRLTTEIEKVRDARDYWDELLRNPQSDTDLDQARRESNAANRRLNALTNHLREREAWQEGAAVRFDDLMREEKRERAFTNLMRERSSEAEERNVAHQEAYRSTFDTQTAAVAERAGISKADYPRFHEFVRRSALAYLAETPDNVELKPQELGRFISRVAQEWHGDALRQARRQMATYTQQKLRDVRRAAPPAAHATAPSPPPAKDLKSLKGQAALEALEEKTSRDVDLAVEEALSLR